MQNLKISSRLTDLVEFGAAPDREQTEPIEESLLVSKLEEISRKQADLVELAAAWTGTRRLNQLKVATRIKT
jgi:hypothetical protein